MYELLEIVTNLVSRQKPDKILALAEMIKQCPEANVTSSLLNWTRTPQSKQDLDKLVRKWIDIDISSEELAGILIGASHAYHSAKDEEKIELVWTGPSTPMMSTRRTEQALLEVINSANESLFLVSFIAYEVASIAIALNDAVNRGVKVSVLMEPAEQHGGQAKDDCFASMKYAVPGARLYTWSNENKESLGGGYRIVHVKCCVADSKIAFISSANLTNAALERNMELGLLIRGNDVPGRLHEHLNSLVVTNILLSYK